MIYPYKCTACSHEFDVIKAVADIDRRESCPLCKCESVRFISRTHFYGASDWHGEEYNPGLGCVVKSNKHKREICKARGLEEIGTTPADDIHKMEEAATRENIERHTSQARDRAVSWMNS